MTLIALIVSIIILGVIAWLVKIAPFIEAQFKSFIIFVLIVVAALIVIVFLMNGLGLVGSNSLDFRLK